MRVTDAGIVAGPGAAVDPLYIKNYALKLQSGLVFLSDYLGAARFAFSLLAIVSSLTAFAYVALPASASRGGRLSGFDESPLADEMRERVAVR
jgi:hypothetical protein